VKVQILDRENHTRPGAAALCRELDRATAQLRQAHLTHEHVHQARKYVKRGRAELQLIGPVLPRAVLRRTKRHLSEAGKMLGVARDAKVLPDTLGRVIEASAAMDIRPQAAAGLANWLATQRAGRLGELRSRGGREVLLSLARAERDLKQVPQMRADPKVLRVGLEKRYRKGRKALRRAQKRPTTARLHEVRKQAKQLYNQLRGLNGSAQVRLKPSARNRLKAVGDKLGKDHDLALLCEHITALRGKASPRARKALEGVIRKKRKRLQREALRTASKAYSRGPARFVSIAR
jgi:CHAD domain-containing protein